MLLTWIFVFVSQAVQPGSLAPNTLIDQARADPKNWAVIRELAKAQNAESKAALAEIFSRLPNDSDKKLFAFALFFPEPLGDDMFMKYLLSAGEQAVSSTAPAVYFIDPGTRRAKGVNPAFEVWCNSHGQILSKCTEQQLSEFVTDVVRLEMIAPPEALDVFRRGVGSSNPVIMMTSIAGLGKLADVHYLPRIEERLRALDPADSHEVALGLATFNVPEADALLRRFVPEESARANALELFRIGRK